MKKIWLVFLMLVSVFCLCFGFAACDRENGDVGGTQEQPDEGSGSQGGEQKPDDNPGGEQKPDDNPGGEQKPDKPVDQQIEVKVYIDDQLQDTLYADSVKGYKIALPEKPADMTTDPGLLNYFDGWYADKDYNEPLTGEEVYLAASAIYGRNITTDINDFQYTVDEGKVTIKQFTNSTAVTVVVPRCIDSYPVTAIGSDAFKGNTMIRTLFLCENLEVIGEEAFYSCTSMQKVVIPSSVTSIEELAFEKCSGLTSVVWNAVNCAKAGFCDSSYGDRTIFKGCANLSNVTFGKDVKIIPSFAFFGCNGLQSIEIPSSVTSIGDGAFCGCGLHSIEIPESVTSIGGWAFEDCSGLQSIEIPESVTSIGDYAFAYCSGLTSVTIGSGVTSIGERAFRECRCLQRISFENNSKLTSIGQYAFYDCLGLQSIELPASVNWIGYSAFYGCSHGLTEIKVDSNNETYFAKDNCLIEKESKTLILGCSMSKIPDDGSVTSIGGWAFEDCSGLQSIEIPESVTSIGQYAFGNCSGLQSIEIPESVTSIEWYAFFGCSGLTSVTIPNSVTSIEEGAFEDCVGLTSVTIGSGVTSIRKNAFAGCNKIIEVWNYSQLESLGFKYRYVYKDNTLSKQSTTEDGYMFFEEGDESYLLGYTGTETSLTLPTHSPTGKDYGIYSYAFYNNSELTSVTIGSGVTSIGSRAFDGCSGLTEITIPNSVTSIGGWAFEDCSGLTSVTIGSGVTSIGVWAFGNCSSLQSVTWNAENCTKAGSGFYGKDPIFDGCDNLSNIRFGKDVKTIFADAFFGCRKLEKFIVDTSNTTYSSQDGVLYDKAQTRIILVPPAIQGAVTIPDGVTSIGWYAFEDCSGLTSVTIGSGVTSIGGYAFCNCSGLTEITIPASVTSIGKEAFAGCGKLEKFIVDADNTAYSSRDGILYDKTQTQIILAPKAIQGAITIPASVTSIGDYAFGGCSKLEKFIVDAKNTTYSSQDGVLYDKDQTRIISVPQAIQGEITIPDGVTSIGSRAFSGCSGLTSVTIGSGVTSIGGGAFGGCSKLEKFIVDADNTAYSSRDGILYDKTQTQIILAPKAIQGAITIPDGVISIGDYAFEGCGGLTSVTIPNSVTSIGKEAFENCSGLTSVTIPNSVTSIGSWAFGNCSGLTSVTIGSNVISIGDYAFGGCGGLTSVTIPNSVTSIGDEAFQNCSGLTSVTIGSGVTSMGSWTFANCSGLTEIHYNGTIEAWKKVEKGAGLDFNLCKFTIYCTDGEIAEDGTETKY